MTTATIGVKGMTCMGCVNSVTKALERVQGVERVEVSLDQHQATVSFDASKTDQRALEQAIEDAGYDVA